MVATLRASYAELSGTPGPNALLPTTKREEVSEKNKISSPGRGTNHQEGGSPAKKLF